MSAAQRIFVFVTVQDRNPCILEPKHKLKLEWSVENGEPAITVQDMLDAAFAKQNLRDRLGLDPTQSIGQFFNQPLVMLNNDPDLGKNDANANNEDGHFVDLDEPVISGGQYSVVLVHKKQTNSNGWKRKHPESWYNMEPSSAITSWTNDRAFRERSQSLLRIGQEAEMAHGIENRIKTEEQFHEDVAVDLRRMKVQSKVKQTKAAKNMDLCFLVDVTGSMQPHIDSVKTYIRLIVDKLTSKDGSMMSIVKKIQLAFVGYRDFYNKKHFEVLQFTNSVEEFQHFCDGIEAIGGKDIAEDVFGGLEKMLALDWSTDGSTRVLFHIADAPCHGIEFHDLQEMASDWRSTRKQRAKKPKSACQDDYPNGDPKGRSIHMLLNQLLQKRIQYKFGKINGSTDRMIEMFKKVHNGEIVVCDVADPDKIFENVVSTSSIAITTNANQMVTSDLHHNQKDRFEQSLPNWEQLPEIRGVLYTYQLPNSFKTIVEDSPLKADQPVKAAIQIAKKPFACGAERFAFYGRDVSDPSIPREIVLKKYICESGKNNGNSADSAALHESAIEMQTIAAFLAELFNMKIGNGYPIKFLKTQMFRYTDSTGVELFMSCEKRYPVDHNFHRFTNNLDYAMLEMTAKLTGLDMQFVEQLFVFSHWTYHITRGYLMVVDLQGIISKDPTGKQVIELTDPAIHCTDLTRFGETNLGEEGMRLFFSRHKCNEVCMQLGLVIPKKFENQAEEDD